MKKLEARGPLVIPADIPSALDQLGIVYDIRGNEAVGLCPSPEHEDRKPSWSCNITNGLHSCFSCGFKGSFAGLVAAVKGTGYADAELWIKTRRATRLLESDTTAAEKKTEVRESDLWMCTPPPAEMLASRRVSPEAAAAAEILWHKDKQCWVFPIRDPKTNKLLGWQQKDGKRVRNRPVSVNKRESLFGFEHVKACAPGPVVVVESPLDVGRFITAGWDRVVATYGIEFNSQQLRPLRMFATKIVFAHDNDKAGQRKVSNWIKRISWAGEDPRDYAVFDYGTAYEVVDLGRRFYVHPAGDGRDPGDLSDEDLLWGAENATSAYRTVFEEFLR